AVPEGAQGLDGRHRQGDGLAMVRAAIRLWGRPDGFHARKVIWALSELELPFELIPAGFGIEPTPEFRDRNPSALAPVIDDAGVVVWESNVIVRYLATA